MGKIIRKFNDKGIKFNVTAICTMKQVVRILKLINKKTKVTIYKCARYKKDLYQTFLILEDKNPL